MNEDAVAEAAAIAGEAKPKDKPKPAPKKARGKRSKGGSKYADYAPARFKRHPAARLLNVSLEGAFEGSDPKTPEVGESWVAAAYWGFGLPPYTPQDGDGHPYAVAVERTGTWLWPKVSKGETLAAVKALWAARRRGER